MGWARGGGRGGRPSWASARAAGQGGGCKRCAGLSCEPPLPPDAAASAGTAVRHSPAGPRGACSRPCLRSPEPVACRSRTAAGRSTPDSVVVVTPSPLSIAKVTLWRGHGAGSAGPAPAPRSKSLRRERYGATCTAPPHTERSVAQCPEPGVSCQTDFTRSCSRPHSRARTPTLRVADAAPAWDVRALCAHSDKRWRVACAR